MIKATKILMRIEKFIEKSIGEWTSMRSGHSLAFKQFEDVVSKIQIEKLRGKDSEVLNLLNKYLSKSKKNFYPFSIKWSADSNWVNNNTYDSSSGSSILIAIPSSDMQGSLIRSTGYSENIECISSYEFLSDNTFTLQSQYEQTIAEERIWFLSNNLRCRSTLIRSKNSSAILQTSHASEIRKINIQ